MKRFYIIGGLFIIIFICLIPLNRKLQEYNVEKNSKLVTATINYIPICSGTKIKYFMKFTYAGKEFDKKVSCGFSDTHKIGDTIKLKHQEGTDIFLFENEKIEIELVSMAILSVFGIALIIVGLKQK
jgi:hypothetical protein